MIDQICQTRDSISLFLAPADHEGDSIEIYIESKGSLSASRYVAVKGKWHKERIATSG